MKYLKQKYAGYCVIIGTLANNNYKVLCSTGKKAVQKTTTDWEPKPETIEVDEIPVKIKRKLLDGLKALK